MDSLKRNREEAGFEEGDVDGMDIDLDDIILDDEAIRKIVDEAPETEILNAVAMKRMLISFERAFTKNQQLRVKYAGSPEKFVESEVELDEEIKKLQILATAPTLYPDLVRLKAHESILQLLTHENTDIAVDALDLLRELTDADADTAANEETEDAYIFLVDSMIEFQVLELLTQNLKRFNESHPDEKKGILNILSIFENITEINEELANKLTEKTDVLSWLLKRLQARTFDDVKQYSSELLSILIQTSDEIPIKVATLNGIEVILMAVSKYKKINPPSMDEEEYLENLFDCLCVICVLKKNKKYFTQAEGLKLLQIIIKNKKYARKAAIKLLDYVMQNDIKNCRRWVNLPGLGTLFAAFMKKGNQRHKKGFDDERDDEHLVSIIATLLQALAASEGKLWSRVVDKFRENEFEKVERLLELHESYITKLRRINHRIDTEKAQLARRGREITSEIEDYYHMQRLDSGLFTLQLIDYIIATISMSHTNTKRKVIELLNLQDGVVEDICNVLDGYANSLGTANSEERTEQLRSQILSLSEGFKS